MFDPTEYRQVTQRVLALVDPDGTLADDQVHEARREVRLVHCRDGSWRLEGRLTPLLGQKMATVLSPLTTPQDGPDGEDVRTLGQRTHDALEAVFDRMLRSDDNPDSGGTPMSIVVTIDYESLIHDTGAGHLPDGTPIAPRTLLRRAAQADIIPVVLDAGGAVLDVGRTRRIATLDQTRGLIARDKGCSFPSCDRTPDWCERHHILAWILGGETAIGNLTLLCPYHHHTFEQAGWKCRMINGLPWWIPPRWVDPDQKPLINNRIRPPGLQDPDPDPDPDPDLDPVG